MQKTAVGAIAPETVCREGRIYPKKIDPWHRIKNVQGEKGNSKKIARESERTRV